MKPFLQQLLLFVLIFPLSLASFAQDNYIVFHPKRNSAFVRIYIDRYGNVYPPGLVMDSTKFGTVSRKNPEYADLKTYLLKYDTAEYHQLLIKNQVSDFSQLQEKIIHDYVSDIDHHGNSYGTDRLVVLIHGFNEYAEAPYDTLCWQIQYYLTAHYTQADTRYFPGANDEIVFLEVFWDGLKAFTEQPRHVMKIWARANRSAPYAAMTLRKLIYRSRHFSNLYIVTHSLGACVGTRILFNTKEHRQFPYTREWKDLPTPQFKYTTLAMLAPAIAGKRVFRCINNTIPTGNGLNNSRTNIVVGYNKYDYATTKSMRFPLSRLYFSTSLGCNPSEVRGTERLLHRITPSVRFRAVDFTNEEIRRGTHRIHHISSYIDRHDDFQTFLKEMFFHM